MALLDGPGPRMFECLRMRAQNLDFSRGDVPVSEGKGKKDRVTMLSESLKPKRLDHLERVRDCTEKILHRGSGRFTFQRPWRESIPAPRRSGSGSSGYRHPRGRRIRGRGS